MIAISAERKDRIAALDYDYDAQRKESLTACNLCGAGEFVILTKQLPALPDSFPNPTLTVHLNFQYQR